MYVIIIIMKYLRLVSDIHLDFDVGQWERTRLYENTMAMLWVPPAMPEDHDTCLMIAGDLWREGKQLSRKNENGESWLKTVSKMFKYVVFVNGNHDLWGANLTLEPAKIRKEIAEQGLTNVFFLEKQMIKLDQVKFIGGTLWTDFNKGSPLALYNARDIMKQDYHRIRVDNNYRRLRAEDLYHEFLKTSDFIFDNAVREGDEKIVVITHMAPSYQSVDDQFMNSPIDIAANPYYASELGDKISYSEIDLWVHGHMHVPKDYMIYNTRVVCNPRGYYPYQDTGYNPFWRCEV